MHIKEGDDTIAAKVTSILTEVFRTPTKRSVIVLTNSASGGRTKTLTEATPGQPAPPLDVSSQINLPPAFKLVFLSVLAITVGCGILLVLLPGLWESPTEPQKSALEAVGFGWKAGLGAIFGLLGGKVT